MNISSLRLLSRSTLLTRLLLSPPPSCGYLMQKPRAHQNRYYRQGLINMHYLPLYESRLYNRSFPFDQRFAYLIFMSLTRYTKDTPRIQASFNYLLSNLNNITQFITIASVMRQLPNCPELDLKQIGKMVRHGQKCFVKNIKGLQKIAHVDSFRNADGTVMGYFLGLASDYGCEGELFKDGEFCEGLVGTLRTYAHKQLYQILELAHRVGAQNVYEECLKELLFIENVLGDDDLNIIITYQLLTRIKDPRFHELAKRIETRQHSNLS